MHGLPALSRLLPLLGFVVLVALAACESDATVDDPADAGRTDSGPSTDAGAADSGADSDGGERCDSLAAPCVSEFGSLFNRTNGRADGTLIALVRPQDTDCTLPNNDHAVLQLSILGHNQRLVVSIDGVAVHTITAPLIGPPYAEGWHEGMTLDYRSDLGVSSADFTEVTMDQAVDVLCGALSLGAPVSVYAFCDGDYPSSAHQIHRNDSYPDGAIVVAPDSASPTWILFRYTNQQF